MGCDTHGVIKKQVNAEDIIKAINDLFDNEAYYKPSWINSKKSLDAPYEGCVLFDENDIEFYQEMCRIPFKYKGEERSIFYITQNYYYVNTDGTREDWIEEFRHTWFDISYWGCSVEIMEKLVEYFGGGWVQKNDCGPEPDCNYYEIKGKIKFKIKAHSKDLLLEE